LKQVREYEQQEVKPDLEYLRKILAQMTTQWEQTLRKVQETGDNEFYDFHGRRLVETMANIIMGHLLILDANRDDSYSKSADIFVKMAFAENKGKLEMIDQLDVQDMSQFKFQY
jgi:hypothetical protein